MSSLIRCTVVGLALVLFGCAEKSMPPVSSNPLARPVLALQMRAGRVLVPPAAITERGGVPGVFVLTPAGQARFRMIRSGKTINARVEILSGLDGNEVLVAGDLGDVHDGSMIKNIPATDKRR